jgi:L-amino acid N-acyltransferase YncA
MNQCKNWSKVLVGDWAAKSFTKKMIRHAVEKMSSVDQPTRRQGLQQLHYQKACDYAFAKGVTPVLNPVITAEIDTAARDTEK